MFSSNILYDFSYKNSDFINNNFFTLDENEKIECDVYNNKFNGEICEIKKNM